MKIRPSRQILIGFLIVMFARFIMNFENIFTEAEQQKIIEFSIALSSALFILLYVALGVFTLIVISDMTDKAKESHPWNITKRLEYEVNHVHMDVDKFIFKTRYINLFYWLVFLIRWIDRNYKS